MELFAHLCTEEGKTVAIATVVRWFKLAQLEPFLRFNCMFLVFTITQQWYGAERIVDKIWWQRSLYLDYTTQHMKRSDRHGNYKPVMVCLPFVLSFAAELTHQKVKSLDWITYICKLFILIKSWSWMIEQFGRKWNLYISVRHRRLSMHFQGYTTHMVHIRTQPREPVQQV